MEWKDYALTALSERFYSEYEFPPDNAEKLARFLIEMSEPEYGEAE